MECTRSLRRTTRSALAFPSWDAAPYPYSLLPRPFTPWARLVIRSRISGISSTLDDKLLVRTGNGRRPTATRRDRDSATDIVRPRQVRPRQLQNSPTGLS